MTKNEFLSHLEKRLSVLKQQERLDILAEYSQHIDIKIESGLSEEEAIKDFGDVDELADEILDAYNVNPNYNKGKLNVERSIMKGLKRLGRVISAIADELITKSPKELFVVFLKLCVVGFCLFLVRFPFEWILGSLGSVLSFLPHFLRGTIMGIISLCFNIVYVIMIFYTLYAFLKKVFLTDFVDEEDDDYELELVREKREDPIKVHEYFTSSGRNPKEEAKAYHVMTGTAQEKEDAVASLQQDLADAEKEIGETQEMMTAWEKTEKRIFPKKVKKERAKKESDGSFTRFLSKMLSVIFKICVFFLLLPFVCLGLIVIVGFGMLITLLIQGYPVIGITLGTFGSMLCLISFIFLIAKGVFVGGESK